MSGEKDLEALLKRLASIPSTSEPSLNAEEVALLAVSLTPTSTRHARSLAYLALSKLSQDVQAASTSIDTGEDRILTIFKPLVESTFAPASSPDEGSDIDPSDYIPFASLVSALFPLSPVSAAGFLTAPISQESEEQEDPLAVLLEVAELPSPLQPVLAELLGSAAGTKPGRELVRQRATEWLQGALEFRSDGDDARDELGAICAVALSKLGQGEGDVQNTEGVQTTPDEREAADQVLARKMMAHIETTPSTSISPATMSTLEGLSVLSLRPHIKALLASSPSFLQALLALSPTLAPKSGSLPVTPRASVDLSPDRLFDTVENSLCYGLTTILVNLTSPKPTLSAEDQQIAKLRAIAVSANKSALHTEAEDDVLDSEEEVHKRVQAVLGAGVVSALHGLVRAESRLVKEGLGKLCRNLVEDRADRLSFVRGGGFKVLSAVIRDLLASSSPKPGTPASTAQTPIDILPACQALAKLTITTSPTLLFPPPHLTTSLNSLTPLYHLLIHPSSTSLQRFEALMALTNLASIDPSIGSRIVDATIKPLAQGDSGWRGSGREDTIRIVVRIEEVMLDDNELVRRAATELVCNLISSPRGYEYLSGESASNSSSSAPSTDAAAPSGRVKSRLNILLVLTSVDDIQTRLAAGGALAIVTLSEVACQALLAGNDDIQSSTTASGSASGSSARRNTWTRVVELLEPDQPEEILDEDGTVIPLISTSNSAADLAPDLGLVHRAVIILLNLTQYVLDQQGTRRTDGLKAIRDAGVEEKLMDVLRLRGVNEEILSPAVECLKMLKRA